MSILFVNFSQNFYKPPPQKEVYSWQKRMVLFLTDAATADTVSQDGLEDVLNAVNGIHLKKS
jgi:hypothetical protein